MRRRLALWLHHLAARIDPTLNYSRHNIVVPGTGGGGGAWVHYGGAGGAR